MRGRRCALRSESPVDLTLGQWFKSNPMSTDNKAKPKPPSEDKRALLHSMLAKKVDNAAASRTKKPPPKKP